MAKPKVFISSTFYDLRHIRIDLERFIRDLGYDTIMNEFGNIPYGKDEHLEHYCYKEIDNADILVSIIGGRYGSESKYDKYSISQMEFKSAYDLNKQVYIFIEKGVYNEYQFYLKNKENSNVNYSFVDNIKIHQFIESIEVLPNNNTIHSFETSNDITTFLKDQWAGLFQRFLKEQTRQKEINIIKGIENTAKTLNQLVTFLTEEKRDSENAINEILLSNHPAMEQIKELLQIPYRVYFTNKEEFYDLIKARGYRLNIDNFEFNQFEEWILEKNSKIFKLAIDTDIFNADNKLKIFTKEEWNNDFIKLQIEDIDDDLPF
ncbi:DUF4062 domain-containing protein [Chishuiella sp.]|uniref:DUF4062 domain-containing protein n=1 Tax=Chishuiella sp. TaxID=1969467 RepID=UPI0028A663E7|nr:DUF4062 domain-containing protein [Chishuiella sp.]